MADVAGSVYNYPSPVYSGAFGTVVDGSYYGLASSDPPTGPTLKFKMRGQDDGVPLPGFVTWESTTTPDFAGAGFASGTPTPSGSMIPGSAVIADEWEE